MYMYMLFGESDTYDYIVYVKINSYVGLLSSLNNPAIISINYFWFQPPLLFTTASPGKTVMLL